MDNPLERDRTQKLYKASRRAMTYDDWVELGWGEDEASKLLDEAPQTKTQVVVLVPPEREGATGYMYDLRHHTRHSPDGFEWGYGGSGPSELARCILIDFLDLHEQAEREGENLRLPVDYQAFKRHFIETAPMPGFELRGTQIAAWLATQEVPASR